MRPATWVLSGHQLHGVAGRFSQVTLGDDAHVVRRGGIKASQSGQLVAGYIIRCTPVGVA